MTAYRNLPALPSKAPRTPRHRLAWAWCRGVFRRVDVARERRMYNARESVRLASFFAILGALVCAIHAPASPRPPKDLQA